MVVNNIQIADYNIFVLYVLRDLNFLKDNVDP